MPLFPKAKKRMDPTTAISVLAPLLLPEWMAAWFWRYYALRGARSALRWLRRWHFAYGYRYVPL